LRPSATNMAVRGELRQLPLHQRKDIELLE